MSDERNDIYAVGTLAWTGTGTPVQNTTLYVKSPQEVAE